MIRTRTRKILRDIWGRKVRTLLVSTSIFIGVLGVVTLFSTGEILVNQLEQDLQQDKLSMLEVPLSVSSGAEIDNAAYLESLSQIDGVTVVEGRAVYPLFWKLADDAADEEFREGTIIAHFEPLGETQIEPVRLINGRFPEDLTDPDQHEIAIEQRMADEYGLAIGDSLVLRVLGRNETLAAESAVRTTTAEIVGIILQPYSYLGNFGLVDAAASVFAPYEDARSIAGFTGLSSIYARYENYPLADENSGEFQSAIAVETPYVPVAVNKEDPAENSVIASTRATNNILIALAMIALIVSGFLVFNVINAIVGEQRRQIGMMKSIGATTGDNFYIYSGMAVVYGLLGVIPGVILGIPLAYFAAQGLAFQSQTVITDFVISPVGIILGVAIGLAVPFLASLIPTYNGTRVQIIEAMSDFGIDANYGNSPLDRIIGSLPLPISIRQAIRSAFQKKFRLALTGLTLTIACASFMGIFALFSALVSLVDTSIAFFGAEITITPNEGQNFEEVKALIENNVDGIKAIEPSGTLAIEIDQYNPPVVSAGPPGVFAIGFNPENAEVLNFEYVAGTGWSEDPARDGIVISTRIADGTGKTVGDTMLIRGGGQEQTFEIIGVHNYPFDQLWMKWDNLSRFGGLVDSAGNPYPNSIDVMLDGEQFTAREIEDVIDREINPLLLENGIVANYSNTIQLADLIKTIVIAFGFILSLAAALIAAVGAVGLLTTLSMSVFERQKEIGVMRSVGATSSTVALQFLSEGLIVGVIAWLIAAPLSYFVSIELEKLLPFGGVFEISYPPVTVVIGLVAMMLMVTVASLVPAIAASRKTVSDILRYQ